MVDTFDSPCGVMMARPAQHVVGWRDGMAVNNREFLLRVAAWNALLRITPGRNFALYMDDSIEFGAALFGAWQAGKIVWLNADTLTASCRTLQKSVDGFIGDFSFEWSPLRLAESPVAPAAISAAVTKGSANAVPEIDSDATVLVVHTSGSTGAAQAIPKRLSQLLSEVTTLEELFGAGLGDASIMATVSHHHIYGLLFKILWPLLAGRAIEARSCNFPEELAQGLAVRRCALIASPAHLKRLPDHLAWGAAADCLRAVFSSGGPLPLDVAQATHRLLQQVPIEVYGSSETGGIAWRQRTEVADEAWQPLPQVDCRVALGDDLLEVRSPHLPDAQWMRLADRVQVHADGRFVLHGRSDRIVKIEEKRISLDAMEALLAASPLVAAVRILLCDDVPGQRQRLAAFVVASESGQSLLTQEGKLAMNRRLREVLAGAIDPVALPRRWRYPDQMPLDAQGKTSRALLLALLDERPRMPRLHLKTRDAHRVELALTVPRELFYFDGHFPDAPVLPGVVQVDWAIEFGRQYFNLAPRFRALHALKFQHVIHADSTVTLELTHDEQKGRLSFRYFSPTARHASGVILFEADALDV